MKKIITMILFCSLVFSINLKPYLDQSFIAFDNKTNEQFIYDIYKFYFNEKPDLIYKQKLSLIPGALIGFNELHLVDRTISLPYNDKFHGYILIGKLQNTNILIFGGNLDIVKAYILGNKHIHEKVENYEGFKLIRLIVDREIPIINDSFIDQDTRKDYKINNLNDNLEFNVYNYPKFLYRIMFNKGPQVFVRDNNEYNEIILENYKNGSVFISVSKNIPMDQYKKALLNCYFAGRFDLCNLNPINERTLLYENNTILNKLFSTMTGYIPKRDLELLKDFALKVRGGNSLETLETLIAYLQYSGLNGEGLPTPYVYFNYNIAGYCYVHATAISTILYLNGYPTYAIVIYGPPRKVGHAKAGVLYDGHIFSDTYYENPPSMVDFYYNPECNPGSILQKKIMKFMNHTLVVYDYSFYHYKHSYMFNYIISNKLNKSVSLDDMDISDVIKLGLPYHYDDKYNISKILDEINGKKINKTQNNGTDENMSYNENNFSQIYKILNKINNENNKTKITSKSKTIEKKSLIDQIIDFVSGIIEKITNFLKGVLKI